MQLNSEAIAVSVGKTFFGVVGLFAILTTTCASMAAQCDVSAFSTAPFTLYFTESADYSISFPLQGISYVYHENGQGHAAMTLHFSGNIDEWIGTSLSGSGDVRLTATLGDGSGTVGSGQGAFQDNSVFGLDIDTTNCTAHTLVRYAMPGTLVTTTSTGGVSTVGISTLGGSGGNTGNYAACDRGFQQFSLSSGGMSGNITCQIIAANGLFVDTGTYTLSWSTSPPTNGLCIVDDNRVRHKAGGSRSSDGLFVAMFGEFSPADSLDAAALACGFQGFDWQQTIEHWPPPAPMRADGTIPTPPFSDPPEGGYDYFTGAPAEYLVYLHAFPFYYNPAFVPSECIQYTDSTATICALTITSVDGHTLNFADEPFKQNLPSGEYLGFSTRLVGVRPDNTPAPILCRNALGTTATCEWSWITTYKGDDTNVGGITEVTASVLPLNGSGTGGITITSIGGVPQVPPTTTCSSNKSILWPPDGKSVPVTVSGNVASGTSALVETVYSVRDEYGKIQPNGNVALATGGNYSFTFPLIAARNGSDLDGRKYTIRVSGTDTVGNVGVCSVVVTVPHDQRRE